MRDPNTSPSKPSPSAAAAHAPGRSTSRVRAWAGPGLLTYGYRPFFLFGAIWSALTMVLWIFSLAGGITLPTPMDPVSWHAHEMLFGALGAFLGGFLLTAIPNWTGRFPILGWPVAVLAATWALGRVALLSPAPPLTIVAADLLFPLLLALAMLREIVAGKNWRNLPVLALFLGFLTANGLFHWQVLHGDYAAGGAGFRLGLAVAVGFVTLIGGRVVPSFTRNYLVKQKRSGLPHPFGPLDRLALSLGALALFAYVARPEHAVTAALCLAAGAAHLIRLARWSGQKTAAEPLVWILHIGYLFIPLGFLLTGGASLAPGLIPEIAAQHIWMIGAVGVMPLAVMSRASLAHAGRPQVASGALRVIYLMILSAAAMRFTAGYSAAPLWFTHLSGALWIAAFAGFALHYWPILTHKRKRRS
ncbi:NnrS family protein [Pararhodobacter oceanensis]|uniref:Short-chain dehydrogenase n=1 Tax=Pararhodobacter oceanensis TaxID=2172121 RepID=A0A2T8HXW9_9RHOB|nr:NnrS family protein [Pararhodobacter oceanensis]PVH30267.1 short-chain dehydrogenase [Pararhodobacter oceanensis]